MTVLKYKPLLGGCELIDTLWNVNTARIVCPPSTPLELIDTLWNVNFLLRTF